MIFESLICKWTESHFVKYRGLLSIHHHISCVTNSGAMDNRRKLTKAILDEATDTFNIVAGDSSVFDIKRLHVALQSLGLSTSLDHEKAFVDTISVDLDLFLQVVSACIGDPNWSVNEIQEAFVVFDREDTGVAEKNDLKRVFTKLGETLSDKDVDDQIVILRSNQSNLLVEISDIGHEVHISADDFVILCKNTDGRDFETSEEVEG